MYGKRKKNIGRGRAAALLLCLALLMLSLTGCGDTDKPEPEPAGTDYEFTVFFGGSADQIEVGELVAQYQAATGITIEAIFADSADTELRDLKRALTSAEPPAAFVFTQPADEETAADAAFLTEEGYLPADTSPAAFGMVGRGLVVDKRVLSDLTGGDTEAFLAAAASATYSEWQTYIIALGDYIRNGTVSEYVLSGMTFRFPEVKGSYAQALNGVYAVDGGDKQFYGDFLISQATMTTSPEAFVLAEETSTEAAFAVAAPVFGVYIQGLGDMTESLAGEYAAGIRGDDFISSTNYSRTETFRIFMDGRAVFTPAYSTDYALLMSMGAEKAANLVMLPLKLPYAENGISEMVGERRVNASLQVNVQQYITLNANAEADTAEKAAAFVTWFAAADSEWDNALESSVRAYASEGRTVPYPAASVLSEDFAKAAFKKSGVPKYLKTKTWNEQTTQEFSLFLLTTWYEN